MLPLLDDFLLNLQTNNYSQETLYNYKAYLVSQDRRTSGTHISSGRLSSFSINRMLSSIRSYLKFLIEMDYKSPISPDMVKLVKTEKKHPRVGEFEQITKLIEFPTE